MGRHKERELLNRRLGEIKSRLELVGDSWQVPLPFFMDRPETMERRRREILDRVVSAKIDYLGVDRYGNYHIFEIKRNLDFEALGQLLGYRKLFCEQHDISEDKVYLHVIFEKAYETIKFIYRTFKIKLWEV